MKIIQGKTNYFFIVKVFERLGSDIRALFCLGEESVSI